MLDEDMLHTDSLWSCLSLLGRRFQIIFGAACVTVKAINRVS
jgi:hypothetical protein